MRRLSYMALALFLCVNTNAATYFVKNGGNDARSGLDSTTNAWATMLKMGATVAAGDTCYILGGTYEEANSGFYNGLTGTLKFANSGRVTDTIVIIGHPNYPRPTIYGNSDHASTTHRWSMWLSETNDYMKFKNINFEHGHKAVFLQGADYVTFEDCKSQYNLSNSADENGGGWMTGWDGTVSYGIVWKRCEAGPCRLGSSWDTGHGDQNLDGWHLYKCWYSLIDSCFIANDSGLSAAVFFKVNNYRDTVRYCNFNLPTASYGIRWGWHVDAMASYIAEYEDSAGTIFFHHNVFRNAFHGFAIIGEGQNYHHAMDTIYFYNNTLYNMKSNGVVYSSAELFGTTDTIWDHHYFFNNIYVLSPSVAFHSVQRRGWFSPLNVMDYNVVYGDNASDSNTVGAWNGGTATRLGAWRTNSLQDAHSQYTNPYLTNPASGDFTMSTSTPTFVKTGGTTINGYGASYLGAFAPGSVCQTAGTSLVSPRTDTTIELPPPQYQTQVVKLRWSAVSGASNYYAQIATDSTFANVKLDYTNSSPSWDAGGYANGESLLPDSTGTTLYWRVRVYSIECGWSTWTSPWKFRLVDSVPPYIDSL
jgi:hypothetical protein